VLSAKTARTLTAILQGVVRQGGTGTRAALGDWSVAGKTGTAQVPDPKGGGYLPGAYVGSFIGFAPATNPQVVVAVVLDRPATGIYGGTVAAPVFREVAGYTLRHLQVPPAPGPEGDPTGAPRAADGDLPAWAPPPSGSPGTGGQGRSP
jgi:cell division protein FtsI (penicillin-binding protein 3)